MEQSATAADWIKMRLRLIILWPPFFDKNYYKSQKQAKASTFAMIRNSYDFRQKTDTFVLYNKNYKRDKRLIQEKGKGEMYEAKSRSNGDGVYDAFGSRRYRTWK